MVAVRAEVAQQLVQSLAFGYENSGSQQGAQVQLGRSLDFQQVLGQQDADDVVALALEDRKAGMSGIDHLVQQIVVGGLNVQRVNARCRDHHVTSA